MLPNYSGGLGVLAGDHLKAASDLGLPLIGVGLLYRSGYFRQSLSLDGWQLEQYPVLDPQGLPLQLLSDDAGEPVFVEVAMPGGRTLTARVWQASVGRVPLLLLDSDIEENEPDLRGVTDRLYGGDQDQRIRQEILVGVGGVRAVRRYCELTGHPAPEVFHTNEGHAGYLGLERIRELQDSSGLSVRRGAGRGARRHRVHHAHPGAGRHRPVPDRDGQALLRGRRPRHRGGHRIGAAARACRWTASSASGPRRTPTCSTWRTWGCGWPSAPTGCRSCTARCPGACSATCGRASTPTRCRSAR